MIPFNIINYIPKALRTTPLMVEFARLVQESIDIWQIDLAPISEKYSSSSGLTTVLEESGYTLYSRLVTSLSTSLQNKNTKKSEVMAIFPLIQAMKGTREGLQRALNILQIDAVIDDRLATDPITGSKIPDMTFSLNIKTNNGNISADTIRLVQEFCVSYVQPMLVKILVTLPEIILDTPLALKAGSTVKFTYNSTVIVP